MIEATILDNGNLRITANDEGREYIAEHQTERDEMQILHELFEPYFTNGSFEPFSGDSGNPFIGLTSAPCIAERLDVDDDAKRHIDGRLWWYPWYETKSCLDELRDKGETVFLAAPT